MIQNGKLFMSLEMAFFHLDKFLLNEELLAEEMEIGLLMELTFIE